MTVFMFGAVDLDSQRPAISTCLISSGEVSRRLDNEATIETVTRVIGYEIVNTLDQLFISQTRNTTEVTTATTTNLLSSTQAIIVKKLFRTDVSLS